MGLKKGKTRLGIGMLFMVLNSTGHSGKFNVFACLNSRSCQISRHLHASFSVGRLPLVVNLTTKATAVHHSGVRTQYMEMTLARNHSNTTREYEDTKYINLTTIQKRIKD